MMVSLCLFRVGNGPILSWAVGRSVACRRSLTHFQTSLDVAHAASAGSNALASLPSESGVRRVNLKPDVNAGTQERSGSVNKVLSRTLYAVPTRQLAPAVAVSAQDSEIETNGAGMEALISVWWDLPPFCKDPQ